MKNLKLEGEKFRLEFDLLTIVCRKSELTALDNKDELHPMSYERQTELPTLRRKETETRRKINRLETMILFS